MYFFIQQYIRRTFRSLVPTVKYKPVIRNGKGGIFAQKCDIGYDGVHIIGTAGEIIHEVLSYGAEIIKCHAAFGSAALHGNIGYSHQLSVRGKSYRYRVAAFLHGSLYICHLFTVGIIKIYPCDISILQYRRYHTILR